MNLVHTDPTQALAEIDLNLLVAFDALARERNVTRAAQSVGVTQSAMSHTLRRLRSVLDDQLLVRGRGSMVLTPRAEALLTPIRSGLVTLGRALVHGPKFAPDQARRAFRIASPDLFDALALPRLLARIRKDAPGIDLAFVSPFERALPRELEAGDVDLAVVALPVRTEVPALSGAGLVRRTLFKDGYSCFMRRDHPMLIGAKRLTLKRYLAYSHALVSPRGAGPGLVDQLLAARDCQRRIALRVPTFASTPALIAESDLILTAPTALSKFLGSTPRISVHKPPLDIPKHAIALIWHERFTADPAHRWLRKLLSEVATEVA